MTRPPVSSLVPASRAQRETWGQSFHRTALRLSGLHPCRPPDHVLAAAVAANADLIVAGGSDLLSLGSHMGVAIVTARQAIKRIADTRQR